jgi:phosphoribosylamine---glycine ligase
VKFLIIGSGAREHSLAWKLAQEGQVYAAPGNPGMEACAETFADVNSLDAEAILSLCLELNPDVVVIGPEDPLIRGVADTLRANGYAVFGPGKEGARLEGSKAFSKKLMAQAGVPTAAFEVFTDPAAAAAYARARSAAGRQLAIKASGAALGKGVIVCSTLEESLDAIDRLMVKGEAGEAGHTLVIEDRLIGREFSLLTLVSDGQCLSLPPAQDHKRAFDGDQGPNTGGMGAVSPLDWVTPEMAAEAEAKIAIPILQALGKEGIEFRGCLFSGIMATEEGPMCLEYNVRLGDPECQAVMRRIGSGLGAALAACSEGLPIPKVEILPVAAAAVTLASEGYPMAPQKGRRIEVSHLPQGVELFHAGTEKNSSGDLITSGGRVMTVTAVGPDLESARRAAYKGAECVSFEGMWMRSDIGHSC